jgi:hypothetical protein
MTVDPSIDPARMLEEHLSGLPPVWLTLGVYGSQAASAAV